MTISIGTTQTVSQRNTSNATDALCYYTKFVSMPLVTTSISANTWTLNFGYKIVNTTNQTGPVREATGNPKYNVLPVTLYIWRPSTGAKVGDIFDTLTAGTTGEFFDCTKVGTNELCEHGTFSGSAVTAAAGDVIIFEAWTYSTDITARTNALNWYYDGATATTTNESVVSNHAAFLETPQALTFSGANQNKSAAPPNENLSIGPSAVPTILRGRVRTPSPSQTINFAGPTNPARLTTKARAIPSQSLTIDSGTPSYVKAKNTNKSLSETITFNAPTNPAIKRARTRALSESATLSSTVTYVQHPNRIVKVISQPLNTANTLIRKSAKVRKLVN